MRLRQDMDEDLFLKDLYYRVNDITLTLPPLRDRGGDPGLLARYFLDRFRVELGRPGVRFSRESERLIQDYPWPGNVRELEKMILRAVLLAPGDVIDLDQLPTEIREKAKGLDAATGTDPNAASTLKAEVEALEKNRLRAALARTGWNRSQAARDLGLSLRGLRNKIRRYQLERERS